MMPRSGYHKRTYTGPRPWEVIEAAPFNEIPDCSRGEMRFAAEAALAELHGNPVPKATRDRALSILQVIAS